MRSGLFRTLLVALAAIAGATAITPALADGPSFPTLLNTDPALVEAIQGQLKAKGFFSGPINGIAGPKTRNAFLSFRRSAHLMPTARQREEGMDEMTLDSGLVQQLLGIDNYEGQNRLDEIQLMKRLNLKPRTRYYRELYDYDAGLDSEGESEEQD